jgi:GT2 family glycosyltransferase
MMPSPKVSFIIPVLFLKRPLNKKRFFMPRSTIVEILDDIERNVKLGCEVIVVCNSQDTELIEFIKNHSRVDKYIINSVNPGVARSWNMGAELSEGEYLCFANDDVRIGKGSIELLADVLDTEGDVAQVGPQGDLYTNGRADRFVGTKTPEYSDVISGFLFLVRQLAYFQAGGFDIAYTPAGWEEIDFSFTLRKLGWKLKVIPFLDIIHNEYHGVSSHRTEIKYFKTSIDTHDLHLRNTTYFRRKWGFE